MVVQVRSPHYLGQQWAADLVARVAASDPSATLRAGAATVLGHLREQWESDDRRRALPPDLVRQTERYASRWVAIRDGRISANRRGGNIDRQRAVAATRYWVAPAEAIRSRLPARGSPAPTIT